MPPISHRLLCFPVIVMHTCVIMVSVFVCTGCVQGDDPQAVALVKKHIPEGSISYIRYKNGEERIAGISIPNERSALEVFQYLPKLEHLSQLKIGYKDLTDDDLKKLPALPHLRMLGMSQPRLTDGSLHHLVGMTGLEHLRLSKTQVRGPGLAHLKDFSKLTWLELGSTPLDDSAMPHIAANFPRLERLSLGNTNVTPDGIMKLVDLHWLNYLALGNDYVGPDPSRASTREERKKLALEQRKARGAFMRKFAVAHIASKQKARAAGEDVPEDKFSPFSRLVRECGDSNEGRKGRRKRDAPAP